ncbi:MAG: glycosyltransferase family 2 protein [Suipraeoptans sp.]
MNLTIVIPNYNGKHFIKPCLDALELQTYQDFQTIIVDNASTDGSIQYIEENYPSVKLMKLDSNYGFSRAVNEGIRAAETKYVILLNNDTSAYPDFAFELVKAIEKSDKLFSVSSKMIQMSNTDLIDDAGDLYTLLGWSVARGTGRSITNFNVPSYVFSACAGAAIYRTSVFEQIGYFDENHFAYLEDIDVGFRAKIFGYKNAYWPNAITEHVGSGTSGSKYNTFKVELSSRNNIYLNYKNMPIIMLIINFIPLAVGVFVKMLFFAKIGFLKDYLRGIKEGFKTMKQQKKVPFKLRHLKNYFVIEVELILNTFDYVRDWFSRKLNINK